MVAYNNFGQCAYNNKTKAATRTCQTKNVSKVQGLMRF